MELPRLYESLFILYKCSQTVDRVYKALEEHRQNGPLYALQHFSHSLAYYIIMEADSFLDEYNEYFVESNVEPVYRERVRIVREVNKPLFRHIYRWKNISQYRDNIVAHGWRNKKEGKRLVVPSKRGYDIPRTAFEFQFLKDLIIQAFHVIHEEFKEEVEQALWFGYSGEGETRPQKDYSRINEELQDTLNEMNRIAEFHGKTYDIKITGYHFLKDENDT